MKSYHIIKNFYTEADLSVISGIPRKTLQRYRNTGEGPPWIRFGRRSIRYPIKEYEEWLTKNIEYGP